MVGRELLFVYGSLLRGEPHHELLSSSIFISVARTSPRFCLYDLGEYPGLAMSGSDSVVGEVYGVDAMTLDELDRFEGHPDLYVRNPIALEAHGDVFTYFIAARKIDATHARIASGDWRDHRARRRGFQ